MDINSSSCKSINLPPIKDRTVDSSISGSYEKISSEGIEPQSGVFQDNKVETTLHSDLSKIRTESRETSFFAKIKNFFLKSSILSQISSFFMTPFRALKSLFCRQPSPETDYKNFISELKKTNPDISIEDAFGKINETRSETERVNRLASFILDENNFDKLEILANNYLETLGILVDDEANRPAYQREALALLLIGRKNCENADFEFKHIKNFLCYKELPYFPDLGEYGHEGIILALNKWNPTRDRILYHFNLFMNMDSDTTSILDTNQMHELLHETLNEDIWNDVGNLYFNNSKADPLRFAALLISLYNQCLTEKLAPWTMPHKTSEEMAASRKYIETTKKSIENAKREILNLAQKFRDELPRAVLGRRGGYESEVFRNAYILLEGNDMFPENRSENKSEIKSETSTQPKPEPEMGGGAGEPKSETPTQPKPEPEMGGAGEPENKKLIQEENEDYKNLFKTIKGNPGIDDLLFEASNGANKENRIKLLEGIFSDSKKLNIEPLTSQILGKLGILADDEANRPEYQRDALLLLLIGEEGMESTGHNFEAIPEDKVRNFTAEPYFKNLELWEAENIFQLISEKIK